MANFDKLAGVANGKGYGGTPEMQEKKLLAQIRDAKTEEEKERLRDELRTIKGK